MTKIHFLIIILIVSFNSSGIFCQNRFEAKLNFPQNLDKNKIEVRIDDGKAFEYIKIEVQGNQLVLSDTFYGQYAAIEVLYPDDENKNQFFYAGFFVDKKPAIISFFKTNNAKNPIQNYKTENAIDIRGNDYYLLKNFAAKEEKEAHDYIDNLSNMQVNDSIMAIAQSKADKYLNKQTEFFKNCSGSYYCLWYFKQNIAVNNTIPSDSLLSIFRNSFSEIMQKSFEGEEITRIINGRSEKKEMVAPDFTGIDINGHKVSLNMFRKYYVLIDFWASWCSPCIKEFPYIKEIRKKYPEDKLKIIFITQDNNPSAFTKAVKKHEIGFGIHIFSTPDLIHLYGAQAIPKTFLIDPNGIIIYNNQIEKDSSTLHILNQLLKEKIQ